MDADGFWQTLWRNSFGSDELDHYTAEYTWLANQMAHAMMGFFLAACYALFVFNFKQRMAAEDAAGATTKHGPITKLLRRTPTDLLMAIPFILLVFKELVDITADYLHYSSSPVPVKLFNPLLDSVTDLLFWYAGIFLAYVVASFYFEKQRYRVPVAIAGTVVCVGVAYFWLGQYWLNQKKTFDRSGLPLNYQRLVKLTNDWESPEKYQTSPIPRERKDSTYRLLQEAQGIAEGPQPARAHYVLSGGLPEDRSRLAVSLGVEFTSRLRFDERHQEEEARRKVVYTTVVQVLDHPEAIIDGTQKAALRCVVIDDLDVTIDPPIELLTEASKVHKELVQYFSEPTRRRIERGVNLPDLPAEAKSKVAAAGLSRPLSPAATQAPPSPDQLDAIKQAAQSVLSEREKRDEAKRLSVYLAIRSVLTETDGRVSTIWVLSNTGEKSPRNGDDPQLRNREKWLYLIAYLTGQTRAEVEERRIELVRSVRKPK